LTTLSDCIILSHLAPGHADATDDLPIDLKGNSTGKRYELAIGEFNSMRICPCFAVVVKDLRFHFEQLVDLITRAVPIRSPGFPWSQNAAVGRREATDIALQQPASKSIAWMRAFTSGFANLAHIDRKLRRV
jgi:hypothetical protein